MSISMPVQVADEVRTRLGKLDEIGAATAEYGVTILVGIAFALAVLTLFTDGAMNATITSLLNVMLNKASAMVK